MRRCKLTTCKLPIPTASKSQTVPHKLGFCCEDHAVEYAQAKAKDARDRQQAKAARDGKSEAKRAVKAARERLKSRTEWLNDAQKVFNEFVRLRDKGLPCVSCQTTEPSLQYHAGHYRTRKAAPHLRFDEQNVWKQCSTCNNHLSGNLILYRRELVNRIGLEAVERIETDNSLIKWTVDDAKRIIAEYRIKIKELKQAKIK